MSNTKRAYDILETVKELSSIFSDVGRNIVFAIIAGFWVLYDKSDCSGSTLILDISLLLAFVYLLIDIVYYGILMVVYDNFVIINKNDNSVSIKDEGKTNKIQRRSRIIRMYLNLAKTILLAGSIACILWVIL